MACLYVIYRYVFSVWRSIRPVEIHQYDIKMATHYDITMGKDVARDAHYEITMGNDVGRDIHCDVTMSTDIEHYVYIMALQIVHNDIAMNLFYCVVFSSV